MPASARLAHNADTGAIWSRFSQYTPLEAPGQPDRVVKPLVVNRTVAEQEFRVEAQSERRPELPHHAAGHAEERATVDVTRFRAGVRLPRAVVQEVTARGEVDRQ